MLLANLTFWKQRFPCSVCFRTRGAWEEYFLLLSIAHSSFSQFCARQALSIVTVALASRRLSAKELQHKFQLEVDADRARRGRLTIDATLSVGIPLLSRGRASQRSNSKRRAREFRHVPHPSAFADLSSTRRHVQRRSCEQRGPNALSRRNSLRTILSIAFHSSRSLRLQGRSGLQTLILPPTLVTTPWESG